MIVEIRTPDDVTGIDGYENASILERANLADLFTMVIAAKAAVGISRIYVTSWRRSSGAHAAQGSAIDFAGIDRDSTVRLWIWLAQNRRDNLGEVIYEQPKTGTTGHVHLTLPGVGGMGQVLWQQNGGGFIEIDPFLCRFFGSDNDTRSNRDSSNEPVGKISVGIRVGGYRYAGMVPLDSR